MANRGFTAGLVDCGSLIISDVKSVDNPAFCNQQSRNESAICHLHSAIQRPVTAFALLAALLLPTSASAQPAVTPPATAPPQAAPAPPKDSLGRDTPRGTLVGFMNAARNDHPDVALLYLDTQRRKEAGARLVHQLYVVIDKRLPARLNELSDKPEG